jgi:hypothetical protein
MYSANIGKNSQKPPIDNPIDDSTDISKPASPPSPASLFAPLSPETRALVGKISALVDKAFPLSKKHRFGLPRDVAELSRLLTGERGSRTVSYLGKPPLLSAYLRYFLPWNIFRLCRLLPHLPLHLKAGDAVTDLGSGPLTFVIALWIARPDLRSVPLEFRCLDRTSLVLEAGEKLFYALVDSETPETFGADKTGADKKSPWIIKTIKGEIGTPVFGQKAALVSAVNVFNEARDAQHSAQAEAAAIAAKLERLGASVLVVEPGVPRGGEFICCLRASLSRLGLAPRSPCTHSGECPMPAGNAGSNASRAPSGQDKRGGGASGKWCHFAFDTLDAPESLHKLSADAGIPKERAVLSFLLAGKAEALPEARPAGLPEGLPTVRIVSDSFPVPSGFGRYGCCEKGLVLVTGGKAAMEKAASGTEAPLVLSSPEKRDPKTNALIQRIG